MYNILRNPEQLADGEMITGKLRWCEQSSSNDQKTCWAPTHLKKKTSPKTIDLPASDFYSQSNAGNSNASGSSNFTCK